MYCIREEEIYIGGKERKQLPDVNPPQLGSNTRGIRVDRAEWVQERLGTS